LSVKSPINDNKNPTIVEKQILKKNGVTSGDIRELPETSEDIRPDYLKFVLSMAVTY
jgi:hypothetical protein